MQLKIKRPLENSSCKKCTNFYWSYWKRGHCSLFKFSLLQHEHNLPNWTTRRETYSATHLVCRAGLGSKMDAVISLKLKVIVKYLYDMEGKWTSICDENEQKMGTTRAAWNSAFLGHRLLRSDRIWRVISACLKKTWSGNKCGPCLVNCMQQFKKTRVAELAGPFFFSWPYLHIL